MFKDEYSEELFGGDKESLDKEEREWYDELEELAEGNGESVAHVEAWIECFHSGKTPQEAFYEEFPQYNIRENLGKELEP